MIDLHATKQMMLRWVWPPRLITADDAPRGWLLHGALWWALVSNLLYFAIAVLLNEMNLLAFGVLVGHVVTLAGLLLLNYRGHTTSAAQIFIAAIFLTIVAITLSDAGYFPRIAQLYVIMVMLALTLLGARMALIVGAASLLTSSTLLLLSEAGIRNHYTFTTWLSAVLDSGFVLYLLMAARYVALHEHQAHTSAMKALDDSEQRYQLLFENAPFGLVHLAADGTILLANTTWQSFFQATIGEQVGNVAEPYLTGEELAAMQSYRDEVLASTGPTRCELALTSPKGSKLWVEVSSLHQADGTIWVMARDFTFQKLRELALQQKARLVEMVSNAIIETDNEFLITTWNPAAERIYGYSRDEVLGKHVGDILASESAQSSSGLAKLVENGEWSGEIIQHRKDGTVISVLVSARVLRDDQGRLVGYLGVAADVTSVHELADERYRKQQLQQLVATHSRSLRDPLAAMLLDLHMLQNSTDDVLRKTTLDSFQHNVDNFERHIRSLLLMTHLDDDDTPYPMPIESVDLADLLRTVHLRHKVYAQQQRQTFELVDVPPTLMIQSGQLELERVFDDLVSYGLRRAEVGGLFRISVLVASVQVQVRILYERDRDKESDTLRRLAAGQSDALRVDTQHSRELEVARKILRLNRGSLVIDLTEKQVAFIITLPLRLR